MSNRRNTRKKEFIAKIILALGLLALLAGLAVAGLIFFREKIDKTSVSENESAPSAANVPQPLNLRSFRGILNLLEETVTNILPNNAQDSAHIPVPTVDNTAPDSFSFAIIGDTKLFEDSFPDGNLGKAVASIAKKNVDMTFAIGDLIFKCENSSACEKSFADWKQEMSPLISKTYEVVGNHDRSGGSFADTVWQKEFNLPTNGPSGFLKQVYSFNFQNSHIVILDTEKPQGGEVSDDQLTWLKNDLSADKKPRTFVFFHEPAFPTSFRKGKSLDINIQQRNKLWKILADNHVTAVFSGHEHFFTRKKIGNIYQFIVGNTDAPQNVTPKPGLSDYAYRGNSYAIVTVSATKINVSLYSVTGSLINSFDFT